MIMCHAFIWCGVGGDAWSVHECDSLWLLIGCLPLLWHSSFTPHRTHKLSSFCLLSSHVCVLNIQQFEGFLFLDISIDQSAHFWIIRTNELEFAPLHFQFILNDHLFEQEWQYKLLFVALRIILNTIVIETFCFMDCCLMQSVLTIERSQSLDLSSFHCNSFCRESVDKKWVITATHSFILSFIHPITRIICIYDS